MAQQAFGDAADAALEQEKAQAVGGDQIQNVQYAQPVEGAHVTVVEGVPVNADAVSAPQPVYASATVAVDDTTDQPFTDQTRQWSIGLGGVICLFGLILFLIGCRLMNYLGFGAGAWYAGLFQMVTGLIFLSLRFETCNPRNLAIAGLTLSIITAILSFIGFLADFIWMGYAKSFDICQPSASVRITEKAKLTKLSFSRLSDVLKCNDDCLAIDYSWDDNKGEVFCYDHNWGDCNDFCDGDFPKLAATTGTFGLLAFFMVFALSVIGCQVACCVRRH